MLITDANLLTQFESTKRLWQGVPKLEITRKGTFYVSFTSGGIRDGYGNYVALTRKEGNSFKLIAVICDESPYYVHDSCLWIDPLGRLWFFASKSRDYSVIATIIENPDDEIENLKFSNEKTLCEGSIFHQPIIDSDGNWLLSAWLNNHEPHEDIIGDPQSERKSFLYRSTDLGKTWLRIGGIAIKGRHYDSSCLMEKKDKTLLMFIRTNYGIGYSISLSKGKTWSKGKNFYLEAPDSTFCFKKLKSGRWLLVRHDDKLLRNKLSAFISEDEGKTFPYKLLLDERDNLSCPFVKETDDGMIHIIYDRERGSFCKSVGHALGKAREILEAVVTEKEIINEHIENVNNLKKVLLKLGKYTGNDFKTYPGIKKSNDDAKQIVENYKDDDSLLTYVFDQFAGGCSSLTKEEQEELAENIYELQNHNDIDKVEKIAILNRIITLCSQFYGEKNEEGSAELLINDVIDYVSSNLSDTRMNVDSIAKDLHYSRFYLTHLFKECTGLSVSQYITSKRIQVAKELVSTTNLSFQEIGERIGVLNNIYLSKWFADNVGMSMSEYRRISTKK